MGRLLDRAIEFLNEDGWRFEHHVEQEWVGLSCGSEAGQWRTWIHDRGSFLIVYAILPAKAPPDRRAALAEFVTRANFGLAVGNFELEFETGLIRFKNGLAAHEVDDALERQMARSLFQFANWTMEDYFQGLMRVIYGGASAEEAIVSAEAAIARRRAEADTAVSADADETESIARDESPMAEELQQLLATLESGFGAQADDAASDHAGA